MRDDGQAHGEMLNKMNQIEKAHSTLQNKEIKCISLPVTSVVDYDLANYQLRLKDSFNLDSFLAQSGLREINCDLDARLSEFASNLSQEVKPLLGNNSTSGALDDFMGQFLVLMLNKERSDVLYEKE